MDTLLYDLSIPAISSLQTALSEQAQFMQLMSIVFDPKYAFLVYSPLAFLADPKVGKKLIMTTVIAEWLNQVLKWFLHGERPYWYVHSSGHFDAQQVPIKQFPVTCELGPGHPSGHAMVTAAVWYVILSSLYQAYHNYQQQAQQVLKPSEVRGVFGARVCTWILYAALLALISVSRVFLGCHFPHQCLVGAALGLLVARWVSSLDIRAKHFVGASVFLFATAFGTFGLLQALGFDPNWTIRLATRHCIKREYIHLDTAPFFSIMRYCGFALGCGLGLIFPLRSYLKLLVPLEAAKMIETAGDSSEDESNHRATGGQIELEEICKSKREDVPLISSGSKLHSLELLFRPSAKLAMALIMARLVDSLGLFVSHSNLTIFYSAAFLAYTTFSFAFVNL